MDAENKVREHMNEQQAEAQGGQVPRRGSLEHLQAIAAGLANDISDFYGTWNINGPNSDLCKALRRFALAATPATPVQPMVDMSPPATARDRWMYEQGRLAERDPRTPKPAAAVPTVEAGQGEHDGTLCGCCDGSGTVVAVTGHLGPDDYEYEAQCEACWGTGSSDIRDAINALSYQPHSVTPGRQMVHRSDVLRIITARAALTSPAPVQQEQKNG
jgi:hypothetical protein